MKYERTPDCICGGRGTLSFDPSEPDAISRYPCPECLDRYARTHCANCDARVGDGGCVTENGTKLCEPCMARRPPPAEDFKALVLRRRTATAAKKQAIDEFHRCRSSLDRAGYAASIVAMRAAEAEEKAALAAIDGVS